MLSFAMLHILVFYQLAPGNDTTLVSLPNYLESDVALVSELLDLGPASADECSGMGLMDENADLCLLALLAGVLRLVQSVQHLLDNLHNVVNGRDHSDHSGRKCGSRNFADTRVFTLLNFFSNVTF